MGTMLKVCLNLRNPETCGCNGFWNCTLLCTPVRIVNTIWRNFTLQEVKDFFGDSVRLQQNLADFLLSYVNYTPDGDQFLTKV